MTTFQTILKLLLAVMSPEFGVVLDEIKEAKRRGLSKDLEAAKAEAQSKESPSTRKLQKIAGELSE